MNLLSYQENYTLLFQTLALILVLRCLLLTFKASKNIAAPEATGAWPIIGHFNLFRGSSDLPHIALASMADRNGPIFTVRLGIRRVLVVSSWEIAKEIFTTHDANVSNRPKYLAAKILGYDYALVGFTPYGPDLRKIRKIISLELLSSPQLEKLKHVREFEFKNATENMHELWREKRDSQGKVLVDIKKWVWKLNMNMILMMVAGKRYSEAVNGEDEDEMKRCREVMRDWFHYLGRFVLADALPFLGWLDLGGYKKNMKRVAIEIDAMIGKWLDEHRRKMDSGEATGKNDFIDVLMSAIDVDGFAEYDADTIIKSTCTSLIVGSADTTTTVLTWSLTLLLNNRYALGKAQEELDTHVGKDRQVNELDIKSLVYLQAVVKETLRLHPSGFLRGPKVFAKDCTVAGYYVPKGTWLMINMWKLQRDPEIWSNPLEFQPERFLTGNKKHVDVKGTNFELIPFGAGRRSCPGVGLGLQMLHMVLATLLQNFDISTPDGAPVDMTASAGLTNAKATPLEVLVTPRLLVSTYGCEGNL